MHRLIDKKSRKEDDSSEAQWKADIIKQRNEMGKNANKQKTTTTTKHTKTQCKTNKTQIK